MRPFTLRLHRLDRAYSWIDPQSRQTLVFGVTKSGSLHITSNLLGEAVSDSAIYVLNCTVPPS